MHCNNVSLKESGDLDTLSDRLDGNVLALMFNSVDYNLREVVSYGRHFST